MAKTYGEIVGDGGSDIAGQVAERTRRLNSRMDRIRHKVAVFSGKGGVGKSVIAANLAAVLASRGRRVGVLDADFNGPCLAKMLGVRGRSLPIGPGGIVPALGPRDIRVVSTDMILSGDDVPVAWGDPGRSPDGHVWRGSAEASALMEFLADTDWGELDFLIADLPPGAQGLLTLATLVPRIACVGVTIPSEVCSLVVRKSVAMAREHGCRAVGLVENMAGYACPHCGRETDLFPGEPGRELGLPRLGRVPFDPRIPFSTDWGVPFVLEHGDSPAGRALVEVAEKLVGFCREGER